MWVLKTLLTGGNSEERRFNLSWIKLGETIEGVGVSLTEPFYWK